MDTQEILRQLRQRRREIINALPPDLLTEYRRLSRLIAVVYRLESEELRRELEKRLSLSEISLKEVEEARKQAKEALRAEKELVKVHSDTLEMLRVSLSRRKQSLIAFLGVHGPSTRRQMAHATGIPQGSLSQLLREPEFENVERGLWQLKKRYRPRVLGREKED